LQCNDEIACQADPPWSGISAKFLEKSAEKVHPPLTKQQHSKTKGVHAILKQ
jgi:hypothetical protein